MIAIGVGLVWVGYTLLLLGYTQWKNYQIGIKDLVKYPSGYTGVWPPPQRTD